jgi:GGDEF domain-containing protein
MYNPGKNIPRTMRLPKVQTVPNYGELEFLMHEANRTIGRLIEQPWSPPDRKQEFLLTIRVDSQASDPTWSLYQITNTGQQEVWVYPTRDLSQVTNLVMVASGQDQLQDLVPSSALMGKMSSATIEVTLPADKAAAREQQTAFPPPRPGAKSTLEGDLKNLQAPNLLQSISLAKMTGRLDVRSAIENASVYFQAGIPLHCTLNDNSGDSAFLELITWQVGEFRFWPDETTLDRTINKRLDGMLMEGVALLDQNKYLETAGLKLESCLVKKNAMISEEEFAARVGKGAPIGLSSQLDFYEMIDNRNTLFDVLRNRPMHKTQWVPILFNLVSCGLVQITDQAPQQNRLAKLKSLGVDENAVQGVVKTLIRPETSILSYPAFIYFLDQEYLRYEHFNFPFSLIVFSIGQRKGGVEGTVEALQMLAVRRAMQRIGLVKRAVDMLGHWETFDYAMLLPNTNSTAASALAHRIADVLREAPLSSDLDSRSLALAFGVATVPEDCQELDKVIIAARKARDKAKFTQQRVVLAREIITPAANNI